MTNFSLRLVLACLVGLFFGGQVNAQNRPLEECFRPLLVCVTMGDTSTMVTTKEMKNGWLYNENGEVGGMKSDSFIFSLVVFKTTVGIPADPALKFSELSQNPNYPMVIGQVTESWPAVISGKEFVVAVVKFEHLGKIRFQIIFWQKDPAPTGWAWGTVIHRSGLMSDERKARANDFLSQIRFGVPGS